MIYKSPIIPKLVLKKVVAVSTSFCELLPEVYSIIFSPTGVLAILDRTTLIVWGMYC